MRNSASRAVASGAAVSLFCFALEGKKSKEQLEERSSVSEGNLHTPR